MKASLLLAVIVPALCGHALDRRAGACKSNGNNCQRGISGTNGKPALASRLDDCASFLAVTVTPEATTETVTYTTTTTSTTATSHTGMPSFSAIKMRQVTETASVIPAYATYCPDAAAYYSACVCAGVTPATTTAPTPTVTYTAATETVTTCVVEYAFRKRGWNGIADFVDYAFH